MNSYSPHPFLHLVAENLIARFGTNLSDTVVVSPGMRTKWFLNNYLYRHTQTPLWSPQYKTIESLFKESSSLRVGDDILLIAELYETYQTIYNNHSKEQPTAETLDEFFFFGEILLNDFNEIDKNRVNAKLLFGNLQDLDTLKDNFSHLSDNQIQALLHHFKHAFQGSTALQTNFQNIWNILGEVYISFKEKLKEKNIAYLGMLMRQVIENKENVFDGKHYAFVGFNILNKCEEQLFELLKDKSSFYWDYDNYYLNTEAGRFIKQNIHKFGSALTPEPFNVFLHTHKKITFLTSPSESGQSAVIPQWIDSLPKDSSFAKPDTAIVLCNETILPMIMHAIPPDKVEHVNITMGFPITQTAISSFLQILMEMQIKGYRSADQSFGYKYVLSVLRHPYAVLICPKAPETEKELITNNILSPTLADLHDEVLFTYAPDTLSLIQYLLNIVKKVGQSYNDTDIYAGLNQESIFRSYLVINRLYGLLSSKYLDIGKLVFFRLLQKHLSKIKVPFHGEPVQGLQIMGVLETRSLDFKNILMLNTNEGYMPGNNSENTFIPQFLRKYVGMNTMEHHDSIYAYHFYRLIARANNITLVYTTNETQTGKAEMSRFLLQLLVDTQLQTDIERFTLQANIIPMHTQRICMNKDEALLEKIKHNYDINTNAQAKSLSPTALTCFIACPYRFYLEYIQGLKSKNELTMEIDYSVFGSIFHRAAELLYRQIGKQPIHSEILNAYMQSPKQIRNIALEAFRKELFKGRNIDAKDYNGKQLINLHIICKMLNRLIQFDKSQTPFSILGLELPINGTLSLERENIRIRIGGIIDRLQQDNNGKHIIMDYKTGNAANAFKDLSELFTHPKTKHIFQTFVYAMLYAQKEKDQTIIPALLYIQQANKEDYSPIIQYNHIPVDNFSTLEKDFKALLSAKIDELFNPDIPFQQAETTHSCQYCHFKERCNR